MSIAADIERVTQTAEGLELELTGRLSWNPDGSVYSSPPGQPALTIIEPTWEPQVGMSIWGGSDSVIIEAKPQRLYRRIGYTRLREAWADDC